MNINKKINLRNQLKNVKIQNSETIQSYFTRVSQIKEKLEVVEEEVENGEIVMTTLNGLPRSWDSFIQGICARRKLIIFSRLWEECSQEEARIVAQEEKMGNEYQALTAHTKKIRRDYHHPKGKHSHQKYNPIRYSRYLSKLKCYTCDERGHFARNCPMKKKKSYKRRHHAHTTEDDEPPSKRVKQESEDSSSDEEYVLVFALMRTVTHGSKDWLIDSGAS